MQKWLDFFWHIGSDRQTLEGGADIAYSTGDNLICGDILVEVTMTFPTTCSSRLSNIKWVFFYQNETNLDIVADKTFPGNPKVKKKKEEKYFGLRQTA
jgi:hypothetical protein